MAFATSYSLFHITSSAVGNARAQIDLTSLSDNGFVGLGDQAAFSRLDTNFFDEHGNQVGSLLDLNGTNGSLDQLSNGNIVVASELSGHIIFRVIDTAGNIVVAETAINDGGTVDAATGFSDALALAGGGFWIGYDDQLSDGSGGDANVEIRRYNNDGVQQGASIVVDGTTARDTGISIAQLDGGNVAAAWARTSPSGTDFSVWVAVYDANGNVVTAAKEFDATGTLNRNVKITAADGGGFALAYEDNGWGTGTRDITLALADATGNLITSYNISDPTNAGDGSNDLRPSITRMTNGVIAVSYDYFGGPNDQVRVQLFDPTTGAISFGGNILGTHEPDDDISHSVLSGFGVNRLVGGAVDATYNDIVGDAWELSRTWTSDGASDVMAATDNLITIMHGNGGDDQMTGGANVDFLNGDAGNDILNGGAGSDFMEGGDGNDTYYMDVVGDHVTEAADEGIDTIVAAFSYTLDANFENLTLTGSAALDGNGNELANTIIGNSGNNRLNGFGGNDSLDGSVGVDVLDGGTGADTMRGGRGSDFYYVDDAGDVIIEGATNGGVDSVFTSVSYTLAANVENVTLTGTNAGNLTANGLHNIITGNDAVNTLIGGSGNDKMYGHDGADVIDAALGLDLLDGGAGADTMRGGRGNDTYIVDNVGDKVVEAANGNIDTVLTSVSFTLASNVENMTATGAENRNLTGNGLANVIIGNSGNNFITGLGGADTLTGGAGVDSFIFNSKLHPTNIDTITDLTSADRIRIDDAFFTGIGPTGALAVDAFHIGAAAADATDRIIYNDATGALYFDADGNGAGAQIQFANVGAGLPLHAGYFIVF